MRFDRLAMLGCGLAAFYGLAMIHADVPSAAKPVQTAQAKTLEPGTKAYTDGMMASLADFQSAMGNSVECNGNRYQCDLKLAITQFDSAIAKLDQLAPPSCLIEEHTKTRGVMNAIRVGVDTLRKGLESEDSGVILLGGAAVTVARGEMKKLNPQAAIQGCIH
jgi:hypothetical protein